MSIAAAGLMMRGMAASPGFARGPLVRAAGGALARRVAGDRAAEAASLRAALAAAQAQIADLAVAVGGDAADILEFQVALIEDDSLLDPVFAGIAGGAAADLAWGAVLDAQVADYRSAPDDYLRARAADLIDLRDRVLAALGGGAAAQRPLPAGAIICAEDLPPSRFLEIDWSGGGGLALERGSASSHVAMLARARAVPMVVQLGALPENNGLVLLDGEAATLELDPAPARLAAFETRRAARARDGAIARRLLAAGSVAWRGEPVELHVNIAGAADLAHPDADHAGGVGLMRTEFLFDGRAGLPDEETQYEAYAEVLRWAGARPVTIRTVDAGGDKPISGFTRDGEANPFLGVRGLRLSLARPDIFRVQLRALARAAILGRLKVMFPMVTVPAEFDAAATLFAGVVDELQAAGVPAAVPALGIMVEVPAAALTIDRFTASFVSIGSNDLVQYVTACDRTNGALAGLADPLNAGVIELIRRTAEHGRRAGIEVSLCGDMAGEPNYAAALLQCGIRQFSMSAPSLARVKQAIVALGDEPDNE
jgi:phosphotransferase system enzyme I (PtsI)